MSDAKVLRLQVTSDSGNAVIPELVYSYVCANCGAQGQLARLCGFGLSGRNPNYLYLTTPENVQTECRDCGSVDNIRTEITETDGVVIIGDGV
jgi:DNA-directed RNA polymerase subunit RPC12/RpoP